MKRFIVSLLCTLLALCCVGVQADAPLHLLWDIPFGISLPEFQNFLEEKTGLKTTIDDSQGFLAVIPQPGSYVEAFGYPADMRIGSYGIDNTLNNIILTFKEDTVKQDLAQGIELEATAQFSLELFEALRQKLDEEYGTSTVSYMHTAASNISEIKKPTPAPMLDRSIDFGEIMRMTKEAQVEFELEANWGNVSLRYDSNPFADGGHRITVRVFYSMYAFVLEPESPTDNDFFVFADDGHQVEIIAHRCPTNDGGAIHSGTTGWRNEIPPDASFARLDASGKVLWNIDLGGSAIDEGLMAADAKNGAAYLLVRTDSTDGDMQDNIPFEHYNFSYRSVLLKVSATGGIEWRKPVPFMDRYVNGLVSTEEGALITGSTYSDDIPWTMTVDGDGIFGEPITYSEFAGGVFYHTLAVGDGGFLHVGRFFTPIPGSNFHAGEGWVVRTDAAGAVSWMRKYSESTYDALNASIQLRNGDFLLCGVIADSVFNLTREGGAKPWLMRITGDGEVVWAKTIDETPAGSFIAIWEAPWMDVDNTAAFEIVYSSDGTMYEGAPAWADENGNMLGLG